MIQPTRIYARRVIALQFCVFVAVWHVSEVCITLIKAYCHRRGDQVVDALLSTYDVVLALVDQACMILEIENAMSL